MKLIPGRGSFSVQARVSSSKHSQPPPILKESSDRRYAVCLATTALSYSVWHHLGSLPDGLGSAGFGTRVADWIDLLVPFLVLTPALLTHVSARSSRATYIWFALGSWLYALGHGIHLSANSIGNEAPGRTAHLWDEFVGHYLWYAGVVVVGTTLVWTMLGRPRPRGPLPYLLALAVGMTWGTNAVGGEMWIGGLVVAVASAVVGWRRRQEVAALLWVAAVPAVAVLVGHVVAR